MVRSLTFAVALALGTVTVPVHALGLGDIKASSGLNQEFKATIDLLSVAKGEIDGIRVRLAPPEEFERAGIERPFFLTMLHFKPERLPDGRAVIRVSSDFPIREPFLDFLIEVNWPKGRLIREYTVLLDPPATTRRRAPATVRTAPATSRVSRPAPTREAPGALPAGRGEYGPVGANETLWSIAKRLRPKGVTMEQMMIALHRANPDAFIGGDINRLKRGQVLRVPTSEEVLSISRAEARKAYREAQERWLERRARRMQEQARQAKPAADGAADAAGGKPQQAKAAPDSELRIATARPEGEGEAGASEAQGEQTVEEIKRQLLLAREKAEASQLESEALRSEIDELQKRLEDMKRLLTLKDEQLARLQAQGVAVDEAGGDALEDLQAVVDAAEQAAAAQPDEDLIAAADAVAEEANARGLKSTSAAGQPAPAEEPAQRPAPAGDTQAEPAGSDGGRERAPESAPAEARQPAPEVRPQPEPPVEPQDEPRSEPGLLDRAIGFARENPAMVAGAGGVLALLLAWLGLRRRRDDEDTLEDITAPVAEPVAAAAEPEQEPVALDASAAEEADSELDQEETSFLSEFSPSDMNALRDETGEVDPIAEADVYIAYGRYQEVEELLKQALDRDPDRLALKHKLLEVYYATRNTEAFNALAADLVDKGQDIVDTDAWARACEMGRELDPDNPRYGSEAVSRLHAASALMAGDAGDVDAETSAQVEETLSDLASEMESLEAVVDEASAGEAASGAVDEASLDLDDLKELADLDDLDTSPIDELESLDVDLASVEQVTEIGEESVEALQLDMPSLNRVDDEAATGDGDLELQLEELSGLSELDEAIEADEAAEVVDRPIAIDEAFDQAPETDVDGAEEAESGPRDAAAVDTKLDLARAFIEMGDAEGAREILEEVRQEGDTGQREQAEKLLADIG